MEVDDFDVWNGGHAGIGAAWKVAGVSPGSTVAIFGLGSVGLAVSILPLYFQLLCGFKYQQMLTNFVPLPYRN